MPIHTRVFPAQITTDFSLFRSDALLKAHPRYAEAKAGSAEATVEFISTIALSFIVQISEQLPSHACYVAPHAREATGDNAIPQVLAAPCASAAAGLIDTDIVQINRVFHTGAAPLERMAIRPDFEGIVNPDTDYVLADDVTTMGGTLAELANYTDAHEDLWKCSGMKVAGASRARPLRRRPASRLSHLLSGRDARTTVWSETLQLRFSQILMRGILTPRLN